MTGQPHDALFRATFSNLSTARSVLRAILPRQVSQIIDWPTLRLESGQELVTLPASAEVRMVLFCLKRVRDGDLFFDELAGFRAICAELEQTAAGRQALRRILSYIQQVTDVPEGHVVHKILEALGPEAKEEFVTLAEKLEQKGLVRGMQQGERRGQQRLLAKQLTLKFGALDAEATAHLEAATLAQLSLFSERVLSAGSLAEVFEG